MENFPQRGMWYGRLSSKNNAVCNTFHEEQWGMYAFPQEGIGVWKTFQQEG